MTFKDFVKLSNYKPTYIAACLLYKPKTRVYKLAKTLGYKPTEQDNTDMRYLLACKKKMKDLFND